MSLYKTIKLNILNTIVFAITGLIFFAGSTAVFKVDRSMDDLRNNIEQHWREQARGTLKNTIEIFEKDYENGLINIYDNESIESWANINFNGIRNGSSTSDGWIGEIGDGIIISDQSSDCIIYIENDTNIPNKDTPISFEDHFKNRYKNINEESRAKIIFKKINNGMKTIHGDNLWWELDEEKEWLEFAYYPKLNGVDGEYRTIGGIKNEEFKRYVFVLGTHSDEIFEKYSDIFDRQLYIKYLVYFTMGISFISSVIFMTVVIFKRCPVEGGN